MMCWRATFSSCCLLKVSMAKLCALRRSPTRSALHFFDTSLANSVVFVLTSSAISLQFVAPECMCGPMLRVRKQWNVQWEARCHLDRGLQRVLCLLFQQHSTCKPRLHANSGLIDRRSEEVPSASIAKKLPEGCVSPEDSGYSCTKVRGRPMVLTRGCSQCRTPHSTSKV